MTKCLKLRDEVSFLNANVEETKLRAEKLCRDMNQLLIDGVQQSCNLLSKQFATKDLLTESCNSINATLTDNYLSIRATL